LKKKEKKYYEYITIKKPTFRLIAEVYLKQPQKILGMRSDTISQLTTLANVTATGNDH
jgi:tRNA (adenine-N(1)-)-methyltransferase non-catalytic subunit